MHYWGNVLTVHAPNPTAEFEETRDKARAMIRALELAQAGL